MTIPKIIGENGTLPQLCKQRPLPGGEGFVKMSRATFEKIARQVLAS